jgi:hypothetical protein
MQPRECSSDDRVFEVRGWRVWSTGSYPRYHSWSAMPLGAKAAVLMGVPDLNCLEAKINDYEADIDWHVRKAREALDAMPAHCVGERAVQESLIDALANLAHRKTLA